MKNKNPDIQDDINKIGIIVDRVLVESTQAGIAPEIIATSLASMSYLMLKNILSDDDYDLITRIMYDERHSMESFYPLTSYPFSTTIN